MIRGRLPPALQPERLALVGQAFEGLGTRAHERRTGLAVARAAQDDGARAARVAARRGLRAADIGRRIITSGAADRRIGRRVAAGAGALLVDAVDPAA